MQFKHQYKKESNRIKDEWRTPDYIFNPLNEVFEFTLDAAANDSNHLCDKYYTIESDGLNQLWYRENAVFVNPPYTEGQYGNWIKKARDEHVVSGVPSVLLVPSSLETDAFIPVWQNARWLLLPYKRISFLSSEGLKIGSSPFSSAIVVFSRNRLVSSAIRQLESIGHLIDLTNGYNSKYRPL